MRAAVDSDEPGIAAALAEIPQLFEMWEQCLSRFRETSELVALNRRSGETVRVSETLWQVTRLALQAAAETDNLVTPTIIDALEVAGYTHSMVETVGAVAGHTQPIATSAASSVPNWRSVRLDPRRRQITLRRGVRLDLAGVAKGWAADQAVRRLARVGPAMIDASGDLAFSGRRADGSEWPIGIEHPMGNSEDLPLLLLSDAAVATSTRGYHRWLKGAQWQHHLIDPRTGRPSESDVFSATIIAPTAAQAEVGAKAAFLLGSDAGMEWIERRPDLAALLILENGDVITSRRLENYTWSPYESDTPYQS
ncbi:MAG: FAD:protein FMN transferase [Anaerolineae bacterium]